MELTLNGAPVRRLGRLAGSSSLTERFRFIFHDVEFQPGTLRAAGFRRGVPCVEETLRTAGKPAALKLETKRSSCTADGEDMLFVTVSIVDESGTLCPDGCNPVKFTTSGSSLCIAAADAGNAASLEPFQTPECSLFSGQAVVYLKSTGKTGATLLRAESPGVASAEITLGTLKTFNINE